MTGIDYEYFIKELFEKQGLKVKTTQTTGDQGVDLVVDFDSITIAIQCKKYSTPVGNKAVQEIFAAKQHIGADLGVVVTNSSYTKSAKELSNSTGVLLLHHDDLVNFKAILQKYEF